MTKSCGNCFFAASPQGFLACTRETPRPTHTANTASIAQQELIPSIVYWLPVAPEWCCGEWAGSDPNVYGLPGTVAGDLVVNGRLTVNPGATGGITIAGGSGPSAIALGFDNGQPTLSVASGTLVLRTADSEIILHVPSGKGVLVEGDAVYATAFLAPP